MHEQPQHGAQLHGQQECRQKQQPQQPLQPHATQQSQPSLRLQQEESEMELTALDLVCDHKLRRDLAARQQVRQG